MIAKTISCFVIIPTAPNDPPKESEPVSPINIFAGGALNHKKPRQAPMIAPQNIDTSPGATMKSAKGTWWGALNGVTYKEDHQRSSKGEGNALHSAWFGVGANRKAKALDLAIQYADA